MRVLVFGSKGQVGLCLRDQLVDSHTTVYLLSRSDIDISDLLKTTQCLKTIRPDIVVNVAAYTHVDDAQANAEEAELVNHIAVSNIAEACRSIDANLIHLSTNYVFDGLASTPYTEQHTPKALSVYASSKLSGEIAVKESGCSHLILRTAWVFSEYGNNFLKTMVEKVTNKDKIKLVDDQLGSPTFGHDVARAILTAAFSVHKDRTLSGTYHFCGDFSCSWLGFAEQIFIRMRHLGRDTPEMWVPISLDDYKTAANRPRFGILNCDRYKQTFNFFPTDLIKSIDATLRTLKW